MKQRLSTAISGIAVLVFGLNHMSLREADVFRNSTQSNFNI